MRKLKPFQERPFSLGGQYDTEISGLLLAAISIQADLTVTDGSAGSTARTDASHRLLGTPEINQGEDPLIRMTSVDWYHLSALLDGAYPQDISDNIGAGASEGKFAGARLPLDKIIPGMRINASRVKAFVRGTFGALSDYSDAGGNLSGVVGTLRCFAEAVDGDPMNGFIRPRITQSTRDLSSASAENQHILRFEEDTLLPALMIRAFDASAVTAHNADGLIRRIRVDVTDDNGSTEVHRLTWGQARQYTCARAGFTPNDVIRSAGIVMIPFSEANGIPGAPKVFRAGHSITVTLDNQATAERHYTSITPAAGDLAYVTALGGVQVQATGDTAGNRRVLNPAVARERARMIGKI